MSNNGNGSSRWQNNVMAITAVLFALFSLFGVNSSIGALEHTVDELDGRVAELERVERHIRQLQEDVAEIAEVRNDILEAIADAIARPNRDPRRSR